MFRLGVLLFLYVAAGGVVSPVLAQSKFKMGRKPKNVILLIGDGMGIAQIYAGFTANKGQLNMLSQAQFVGLHKTNSASHFTTDSGAGGTALSIGQKTYNGAIGVSKDSVEQETILESAEKQGLATGLVSTSSITHATPASFIAHEKSRSLDTEIAADFLKTDIDVFIGGGAKFFKNGPQGRNLVADLEKQGYQVRYTWQEAMQVNQGKLAALTAEEHNPKFSEGRGEMLPQSTTKAISLLKGNKKGFFLMVEGSQIDWGGHNNDLDYIVTETVDFDKACGEALKFAQADGQTLVIITADHECGGLAITGGDFNTGKVEGKFGSKVHTPVLIPVFAYGPGAERFTGVYENTEIYHKMMELLRLKK
ncbi:MAG: alkaline phosphatase [Bernardetiaceae bacterium]|jgi:alkaline phosphatase|nr:alkaline phosphatase [Bernardetiaceae bacterium]